MLLWSALRMWVSQNKAGKCRPGKRAAKCKFCLERGYMAAHRCIVENQGKPDPLEKEQTGESSHDLKSIATPEEQFLNAYNELNKSGQDYVEIPDLREALKSWSHEEFNKRIAQWRNEGKLQLFRADPALCTQRFLGDFYSEDIGGSTVRFGAVRVVKVAASTKSQTE